MEFLKELLTITESATEKPKKKKDKKDKSADKYFSYISGNMMFQNTCSGDLSGTKKIEK